MYQTPRRRGGQQRCDGLSGEGDARSRCSPYPCGEHDQSRGDHAARERRTTLAHDDGCRPGGKQGGSHQQSDGCQGGSPIRTSGSAQKASKNTWYSPPMPGPVRSTSDTPSRFHSASM